MLNAKSQTILHQRTLWLWSNRWPKSCPKLTLHFLSSMFLVSILSDVFVWLVVVTIYLISHSATQPNPICSRPGILWHWVWWPASINVLARGKSRLWVSEPTMSWEWSSDGDTRMWPEWQLDDPWLQNLPYIWWAPDTDRRFTCTPLPRSFSYFQRLLFSLPFTLPTAYLFLFHQKNLSADSVVGVLDLLSVVVEGAPPEEQNSNATAVIASTFSAAAVILQEQKTQLTVENKTEVRVQTVYCFFIVYPAWDNCFCACSFVVYIILYSLDFIMG